MRGIILLTAFCCLGWTVKAQDTLRTVQLDEVVITGTKSEIPVEKSGKSIFKISREEIENSSSQSVADLLNDVPGVQINGNFGPMGTNISYFVRGASSKRTLILIDGVPFNDPSGVDQTYDLRLLDLNQVESIEILKGGLSSLYGTGAAAGVINITLKKGTDDKLSGSAGVEYGSFNTFSQNANAGGRMGGLSYQVSGSYLRSDGFSAAEDQHNAGGFDDDGFEGFNFLGKLGHDFSDNFSLGIISAFDKISSEYDEGEFTDASGNEFDSEQFRIGLSPRINLGQTKIRAELFYTSLNRLFVAPDSFLPRDEYDAGNFQADVVVDQNINNNLKLLGGLNFQYMSFSQPSVDAESFSMVDPYFSLIYDQNNFNVQAGARVNQHSEYGTNFVWNINPSYLIDLGENDLKLFTSYSTSFIAPALSQLFGLFGPNPDLEPEDSKSVEGGASILGHKVQIDIAYFYRWDENLIIFGADGYENADENIETDGIELSANYKINKKWSLNGHYTYVNAYSDSQLLRIPNHKFGLGMDYQPIEELTFGVDYLFTGEMEQPFFNLGTFESSIVNTDSFNLIDVFISYKWRKLTGSLAVNNLLDESYQPQFGFNAAQINYIAGLKYSF